MHLIQLDHACLNRYTSSFLKSGTQYKHSSLPSDFSPFWRNESATSKKAKNILSVFFHSQVGANK